MSLSIDFDDRAARKVLQEMGPNTRKEILRAYFMVGINLKSQLIKATPRDTGTLANAHGFALDKKRMRLEVFNNKAHALPVHEGRRKGATMPPTKALQAWARRKLGNPKLAFVVARAIQKRGIKGRPWFDTTIRKAEPGIALFMRAAVERAVAAANR